VVKADGSRSRGCGFEPLHHILDGCKPLKYKKIMKIKVAEWGTPKKKYFYPYPSSFLLRGSHLLPGQDLDVISIPFHIYFFQDL
jgi:hypothetical protein